MHFSALSFHSDYLMLINLLAIAVLVKAYRSAPWGVLGEGAKVNAWLGGSIIVAMLWVLRAVIQDGLSLHLLGATALTLMVGPWFAMLGLLIVILALGALGVLDWGCLGLHWLLLAVLPVCISQLLLVFSQRLPAHYFVYIFINAFVGAALSMLMVGLVTASLYQVLGIEPSGLRFGETMLYFVLLGWAEAFTTGIAMTLIVVYYPQWTVTFDDARYLRRRD
ncbi:putative membrane protein [Chitinivorax tropicus]|uniref:Putative membrane protein n=1 Tax=Chitinivorax tropicus TaxID=714531 RepID=A0A840MQW6_9PROT|nr:energy-coupling factor ABC transporter permease [Chitinivorax tropicus]MBB5018583.1 putative membrane protein [Chitinivorax tropicus]